MPCADPTSVGIFHFQDCIHTVDAVQIRSDQWKFTGSVVEIGLVQVKRSSLQVAKANVGKPAAIRRHGWSYVSKVLLLLQSKCHGSHPGRSHMNLLQELIRRSWSYEWAWPVIAVPMLHATCYMLHEVQQLRLHVMVFVG